MYTSACLFPFPEVVHCNKLTYVCKIVDVVYLQASGDQHGVGFNRTPVYVSQCFSRKDGLIVFRVEFDTY